MLIDRRLCPDCIELVAAAANDATEGSSIPGAPVLSVKSKRATVVAWLQWFDPDNAHADKRAAAEGIERYNLQGAWETVESFLSEDYDFPKTCRH